MTVRKRNGRVTIYAATFGGLSTSADGGKSFSNITTAQGLSNNQIHGVAIDDRAVIKIYVAIENGLSVSVK